VKTGKAKIVGAHAMKEIMVSEIDEIATMSWME
jgi:hypothetical protein